MYIYTHTLVQSELDTLAFEVAPPIMQEGTWYSGVLMAIGVDLQMTTWCINKNTEIDTYTVSLAQGMDARGSDIWLTALGKWLKAMNYHITCLSIYLQIFNWGNEQSI